MHWMIILKKSDNVYFACWKVIKSLCADTKVDIAADH